VSQEGSSFASQRADESNGNLVIPALKISTGTSGVPLIVEDLFHLPLGSHCISFHTSREEASDRAVSFLEGAPEGQPAAYWVTDPALALYYNERLATRGASQVGCVQVMDHEQVKAVDGKLRPADEVLEFVGRHPGGVTGGADTISAYWGPENVAGHLEYEAWFEGQPRDDSRFLCPYDLRTVPVESAPRILRELGRHHSHAALSDSEEPAVRLLQLFVFGSPREMPRELQETLAWASSEGLVWIGAPHEEIRLSPSGERVVREWSRVTTIDW
jgi:hypothetical protein